MASEDRVGPSSRVASARHGEPTAVFVAHVDYTGRLRGRIVPAAEAERALERGVTFNRANLNLDLEDRLPADPILPSTAGDYATVGIPESWRAHPADPSLAIVFTRFRELDGTPWGGCPRSALEGQVARLASLGVAALVGFEQEGYLLERGIDAPIGRREFSASASLRALGPFREGLFAASARSGLPLIQLSKEMGPHQFEFNLPPRDPVTAAEDLVVAKEAAHGAAAALGLRATFMPKPWSDQASSGLHVHLSLHAAGEPSAGGLMDDPADPTGIGVPGQQAAAGILAHAQALAFLAMPTVNSGKRLRPGEWTPVLAAWSPDARDALVRWAGAGSDRRIEYRGADGCASSYLLLAGLLGSIAEGLEQRLSLDGALRVDGAVDRATVGAWEAAGRPVLPRTLDASLRAFEHDPAVRATVGEPIASVLAQVRRSEVASAAEQVGPWERGLLLDQF